MWSRAARCLVGWDLFRLAHAFTAGDVWAFCDGLAGEGLHLGVGTDRGEVVVHVDHPGGEVLLVPGVALDLWNCDALVRLGHQDAAQDGATFLGGLHVGWKFVIHLQDSLQKTRHWLSC